MTLEKVSKIIADYKKMPQEDITADTTFADLGLDSLDLVELIMQFEEDFDIAIDLDTLADSLTNVGDAVKIIDSINNA